METNPLLQTNPLLCWHIISKNFSETNSAVTIKYLNNVHTYTHNRQKGLGGINASFLHITGLSVIFIFYFLGISKFYELGISKYFCNLGEIIICKCMSILKIK